MDEFRKELEDLLSRHPDIGDVPISVKRTVSISLPSEAQKVIPPAQAVTPVPLEPEAEVLDEGAQLDKIAGLKVKALEALMNND